MKKRTCFLAALALTVIAGAGIGRAWAYFTTYTEAAGGYAIELGDRTEIGEPELSNWTKHVVITSEADSQPVYIRAKAFSGSTYTLVYSDASGKWSPGEEGYYYYSDIVNGGESTEELLVQIQNIPEDAVEGDSFNVAVIYESTPVLYDEQGNPYADWNTVLDVGEGGDS